MSHVNLEFPGDYRADFGYRAIETMAEFVRNARHKPLAPDDNAIAEPSVPASSPFSSAPFPDEGQALQSSGVASGGGAGGAPPVIADAFCDSGAHGIAVDVVDDIAYILPLLHENALEPSAPQRPLMPMVGVEPLRDALLECFHEFAQITHSCAISLDERIRSPGIAIFAQFLEIAPQILHPVFTVKDPDPSQNLIFRHDSLFRNAYAKMEVVVHHDIRQHVDPAELGGAVKHLHHRVLDPGALQKKRLIRNAADDVVMRHALGLYSVDSRHVILPFRQDGTVPTAQEDIKKAKTNCHRNVT